MCRNIKPLFNYEPHVTDAEIRASALQYVRKVSGFNRPSQANEAAFERAVERVSAATRELLASLTTPAPPRSREAYIAKRRESNARRFAREERSDART
jgi:hypothetical protein